jgi:hypothetical protein
MQYQETDRPWKLLTLGVGWDEGIKRIQVIFLS